MEDLDKRRGVISAVLAAVNRRFSFSHHGQVYDKSGFGTEMVTELDQEIDRFSRDWLKRVFPQETVVSEESNQTEELPETFWLLDPIDGTHNLFSGSGLFGVLLAYCAKDTVLVGGVLVPAKKEIWTVQTGSGIWLNGSPYRIQGISAAKPLALGNSALREAGQTYLNLLWDLSRKGFSVRLLGSEAVGIPMLIRAGGVFVAGRPKIWDVAVLALTVKELGGRVTDLDGGKWSVRSDSIAARLFLDEPHEASLEQALKQLKDERDHAVR